MRELGTGRCFCFCKTETISYLVTLVIFIAVKFIGNRVISIVIVGYFLSRLCISHSFFTWLRALRQYSNCRLLLVTSGNHLELLLSTMDDVSDILHQIPLIFKSQKGAYIIYIQTS
jgi:hypothetical protein